MTNARPSGDEQVRRARGWRLSLVRAAAPVALLAAFAVSACSTDLPRPEYDLSAKPKQARPVPDDAIDTLPTKAEPIVFVDLPPDVLKPFPITGQRPLSAMARPGYKTERHTFSGVPLEFALRAILDDTGVGLVLTDDVSAARPVSVDITGAPDAVADRVCRAGGVYCSFADGAVEVRSTETFTITLPAVAEMQDGVKETVSRILGGASAEQGGGDKGAAVVLDKVGNRLTYTATMDQERRVEDYLSRIKDSALLVYETWISEVQLNEQSERGIDFNKLSGKIGPVGLSVSGGHSVGSAEALGIGSIYNGARLSVDVLMKFLAEQGSVSTLASPTLTMMSGTSAEFSDGGKESYVYQVGVITNGTTTAASGAGVAAAGSAGVYNSGLLNNTVQTKDLDTGTRLKLSGMWQDNVINTGFDLKITDLVTFKTVESSGTTLQLPKTVERELKSRFAIRPGDALLVGGIRSARAEGSRQGLPVGGEAVTIPTGDAVKGSNRELVIMIKPKVVVFRVGPASAASYGPVVTRLPPPPADARPAAPRT